MGPLGPSLADPLGFTSFSPSPTMLTPVSFSIILSLSVSVYVLQKKKKKKSNFRIIGIVGIHGNHLMLPFGLSITFQGGLCSRPAVGPRRVGV